MRRLRIQRPSEFIVVGILSALAALLFWDTLNSSTDVMQRGPVGPRTMPVIVGVLLLTCALLLAVDLLRGRHGTPEDGAVGDRSDWRTWGLVVGAILLAAASIEVAGWVLGGAVMFYLCLYAFGSKRHVLDLVVSAGMALGSFYLFYSGLGIALPAGPLEGVL